MNKKEMIRALKFLFFSISAGLIQTASFAIMEIFLSENYWVCYLTSLILSVLWNFTLNRKFTFKSANNVPIAMVKVAIFYLIFTPLSTYGGQLLSDIGWNEYLILAISMVSNFILEFLYQKYFVFKGSIDSAEK